MPQSPGDKPASMQRRKKSTSSSDIRLFFKPKSPDISDGHLDKRKREETRSSLSPVKKKTKEEDGDQVLRAISPPQQQKPGHQKTSRLRAKENLENLANLEKSKAAQRKETFPSQDDGNQIETKESKNKRKFAVRLKRPRYKRGNHWKLKSSKLKRKKAERAETPLGFSEESDEEVGRDEVTLKSSDTFSSEDDDGKADEAEKVFKSIRPGPKSKKVALMQILQARKGPETASKEENKAKHKSNGPKPKSKKMMTSESSDQISSKQSDNDVKNQFSSESDDEILFKNSSNSEPEKVSKNCENEKDEEKGESLTNDGLPPVVIPLVKPKAESGHESDKDEDLESYEVEKIVNYSWCRATMEGLYRVKWVNWADKHNTWEPISNLVDCQELLKAFYLTRLKERENATPGQKRLLEVPPDPRSSYERRSDFADKICPPPCMSEAELFMKSMKDLKRLPPAALKSKLEKVSKKKNPDKNVIENLRNQIMFQHIEQMKRDQLERLKEWEKEVNDLSTENAMITVENDFDLEGPPRHMTYINEYKPSPGIVIPDDPPIGCECEKCGIQTEKSCCPGFNGHLIGYSLYGKLRVPLGHPIYECNKKCKCGPDCSNRVVQKGRKVKLCIYRTSNGCGWGVKTLENIKRGSFVVEYVGEVITSDEAEERGKKYDAEGRTYLFDLDYNMGDANPYTVDAAFYGNVSHFINHSCDPNLGIYNVWIDCLDPNLPRLCMFALRDIVRGEQITFDYRQRASDPSESSSTKNDEVTDEGIDATPNRMECRCGTANCRKILFG